MHNFSSSRFFFLSFFLSRLIVWLLGPETFLGGTLSRWLAHSIKPISYVMIGPQIVVSPNNAQYINFLSNHSMYHLLCKQLMVGKLTNNFNIIYKKKLKEIKSKGSSFLCITLKGECLMIIQSYKI